ncbi:hypothetical protein AB0H71_02960 [Nocardia sp. NPDC050697]|uniref:hypothetical protein n=1 Tax=Nocardia sp. NPDC050697 TaxID=3155158 RepID=UPI0033FDC5E0
MRVTVARRAAGEASTAVRRILFRHAGFHGLAAHDEVRTRPGGAPYCTRPGTHVSLTHDAEWLAAATCPAPVGVDVQRAAGISPRFARRLGCASAAESAASWSVREAVAKLRGRGLADAPWRYDLRVRARQGRFDEAYWLCVPLGDDTFLAAASTRPCALVLQEVSDDDVRSGGDPHRDPRPGGLDPVRRHPPLRRRVLD